jgi:hypothetical protein
MKKVYRYEEDKFLRIVHKMNQSRGFYMPKDKKRFILTILFSVNIIVLSSKITDRRLKGQSCISLAAG